MKRRLLGIFAALGLFGAGFVLAPQLASASPPSFQVVTSTLAFTAGTAQKVYCPSGQQEVSFGYSQAGTTNGGPPAWAFPFTDSMGSGYEFNWATSATFTVYVVCTA